MQWSFINLTITCPFSQTLLKNTPQPLHAFFSKDRVKRWVLDDDSIILDLTEQKAPPCSRHVAALARLVQKVELIAQKNQLVINADHAVTAFPITPGGEKTAVNIVSQPHIIFQNNKIKHGSKQRPCFLGSSNGVLRTLPQLFIILNKVGASKCLQIKII